ncbi:hypothetical protein SLS60_006295 [Paraconiothyrium brasiliense]|uniref:Xylanolytic transcriptional activator regulatory domain-containing protein n=1 Tax=Paraconiothyrium brasiliense TaxID=300254 RepID=A0ABR3RAR9_9PLEO
MPKVDKLEQLQQHAKTKEGISIRMAHILRLNEADSSDTPILAETKRRIWCTLFVADRWNSSAMNLPFQIGDDECLLPHPVDEYVFQQPQFGSENARTTPEPGLWAHRTTLTKIFGRIQVLNQLLIQRHVEQEAFERKVEALALQLYGWQNSLKPELCLTEATLEAFCHKKLGGAFIDLHLGFHYYNILLYFRFLQEKSESFSAESLMYTERCKKHAMKYSELLRLAGSREHCKVVHATVGHMTVVSSMVLLHVLLRGEEADIAMARDGLSSNFEALLELQKLWPMMDRMVSSRCSESFISTYARGQMLRLYRFQTACLQSKSGDAHTIDNKMLQCLREYIPCSREAQPTAPTL